MSIADHGIGIPASDIDRLFERYHRGGNVSGIVGTGVGLYLVKMVVDLHGGAWQRKDRKAEAGVIYSLRYGSGNVRAPLTAAAIACSFAANEYDSIQAVQ